MNEDRAFVVALAEELAPDEVDVAPAIADAAVAGGAAWDQLARPASRPTLGGVAESVDAAQLLAVVSAIAAALNVLASFCASALQMRVNLLAIQDRNARAASAEAASRQQAAAAEEHLKSCIVRQGVEPERAERMARGTLAVIAREPERAQGFLSRLAGR